MSEGLLLLLDCAFVLHLIISARRLPDRVASHFQFDGQADGWISRRTYIWVMAFMGPGLSVIWPLIALAIRDTPANPIGRHVIWVGCLILGFIFGVHGLTVQANRRVPPELPMKLFWGLFGLLQVGLVLWIWALTKVKI